jgi:uncharacterized protein
MRIAALRRYPVKSMGGEGLREVDLDGRGLVGDRWYAVEDEQGHFASGKNTRRFRRRDPVFGYVARTDPSGAVVVSDGTQSWAVGDPDLDARLSAEMGLPVAVRPEAGVPHQDDSAVSLIGTATLGWCAERWGGSADPRRVRANIVVETDDPFAEEAWVGRDIRLGTAELSVVDRTPRCRMVDIAQDGVEPGAQWLKPLGSERDLMVGIYAEVRTPGRISVGDSVALS